MIRPHKRYSFWVLALIGACSGIPQILPSIESKVTDKVFVGLSLLGMVAQYVKQEAKDEDGKE